MPKKLRKIFIILTPFILLLVALTISLIPDFYRISITPAGKTYTLLHNHLTDYYYYLSLMHQGFEGNWLLTSRVTSENFQPVFAQTFFALLGNLARVFHVSLTATYFISRIAFGGILMLAVLFLVRKIFRNKYYRIFACLMVFFSTGFWAVSITNGKFIIHQFLTFWTRMDPMLRTTYLPHHVFSTALGILSVVFLSEALERSDLKKVIVAGLCGFLAGFIYFASMINIFGGMLVSFIIFLLPAIITKSSVPFKLKIFRIFLFFLYFLLSGLSFVYLFQLSRTTFPWSSYNSVTGSFVFDVTLVDYIASLGPTFLLALLGLKSIISGKGWLPKLLLGWAIFPFAGLFFISRIYWQFANAYYLEAASYIPLGILSVYGLDVIKNKVSGKKKGVILILTAVLAVYFSIPLYSSVRQEMQKNGPYYYNIYISNEVLAGISWLDLYTPAKSVVLSGGDFGSIIPAYTHNRVVYGHKAGTYNAIEKIQDVNLFFSQKDKNLAWQILRRYGVSYVFYAADTDPPGKEFIESLPLSKVFENNAVIIYKTNK